MRKPPAIRRDEVLLKVALQRARRAPGPPAAATARRSGPRWKRPSMSGLHGLEIGCSRRCRRRLPRNAASARCQSADVGNAARAPTPLGTACAKGPRRHEAHPRGAASARRPATGRRLPDAAPRTRRRLLGVGAGLAGAFDGAAVMRTRPTPSEMLLASFMMSVLRCVQPVDDAEPRERRSLSKACMAIMRHVEQVLQRPLAAVSMRP